MYGGLLCGASIWGAYVWVLLRFCMGASVWGLLYGGFCMGASVWGFCTAASVWGLLHGVSVWRLLYGEFLYRGGASVLRRCMGTLLWAKTPTNKETVEGQ